MEVAQVIRQDRNPSRWDRWFRAAAPSSPSDFERASCSLGGTQPDLCVLSVRYNQELSLLLSVADKKRIRSAVVSGDATILFEHHYSHVASGVERLGAFFGCRLNDTWSSLRMLSKSPVAILRMECSISFTCGLAFLHTIVAREMH